MNACRSARYFAFAAVLTVAGGWLCAQESPFTGAKTVATPGLQPVSPAVTQPFASAQPMAVKDASAPTRPAWADETLDPSGRAKVERVVPGKAGNPGTADVVVLDGGTYQGMRDGVICYVERNNQPIAELVIVATQPRHSAGLITGLVNDSVKIQPGDVTRFKKLEFP